MVHRNGQAEPCGEALSSEIVSAMYEAAESFGENHCPDTYDKYDFESFLTQTIADSFEGEEEDESCGSEEDDAWSDDFLAFCDMGEHKTPILLDHERLVPIPLDNEEEASLPCHFHTREGVRISSFDQLKDVVRKAKESCKDDGESDTCAASSKEVHLHAVPAGRVFMFAPSFVGETFDLPHVSASSGLPVSLEVLSVEPRVFEIYNFFDKEESDQIIKRAKAETSETHRMKRSTTGASSNSVFQKRTSDSGFDTHGSTAQKVKRRCMSALGFDKYEEGHTDGLQVLRYNLTKAYVPHMDYLSDNSKQARHDYDSAHLGGNRYATILLYMSDLEEGDGGETVFAKGWPADVPVEERKRTKDAIRELRESGDSTLLKEGSWEEEMVAQCRSRLAVRPNSARAVLFYSMHPNGVEDKMSLHGGCPVLKGEKWAANLWVWNTPRDGFEGSPVNKKFRDKEEPPASPSNVPVQISAQFINTGKDPLYKEAELYFDESGFWGKIGHGEGPLGANTYEGHQWNIKVNGKFVKQFVIGKDLKQTFYI